MYEFENIKVGDKVMISTFTGRRIAEVTKVTNTTFSCGEKIFNKRYGRLRGAGDYCTTYAHLVSEEEIKSIEIENENKRYNYILNNYNWENVSIELKKEIYKMLEENKDK